LKQQIEGIWLVEYPHEVSVFHQMARTIVLSSP